MTLSTRTNPGSLRWSRILIAAVLLELVLFVIAAALYPLPHGETVLLYVIPPACLAVSTYFGFWAARTAQHRPVLHGALVGIIAAVVYVALTWKQTLPMVYVVSHFLKIIGGTLGGAFARRHARPLRGPS